MPLEPTESLIDVFRGLAGEVFSSRAGTFASNYINNLPTPNTTIEHSNRVSEDNEEEWFTMGQSVWGGIPGGVSDLIAE